MKVLVTGGAGFIGSAFVRRLAGQGDQVVVLDKLTYAGNPANLEGVEHEFHKGDIADADAVARAAKGARRSSTSPRRRMSTARSSARRVHPHGRARHAGAARLRAASRHPSRAGVDRRGLRRHPARRAGRDRGAPLRPSSPYAASKAGGDLQVLAYVRTYGTTR
jgi:dTDP-D-glucose 4,6-dehydratase